MAVCFAWWNHYLFAVPLADGLNIPIQRIAVVLHKCQWFATFGPALSRWLLAAIVLMIAVKLISLGMVSFFPLEDRREASVVVAKDHFLDKVRPSLDSLRVVALFRQVCKILL
jgi:hypothetical protein